MAVRRTLHGLSLQGFIFTKALDLKPGDPYALNGLGAASAKSGDEASAMHHFEAAIEANPRFPEPRFGNALLLKNQGHLDGAANALDSLLREATPEDARSNPVFQRAEQLLASIRKEIRERGGPTNPELLQEKCPAAVWHLLDALKRFDSLDPRRVGEITFEVARLGENLSRRHQDAKKNSCPARCCRPLRLVFRFASFASRSCRPSGCLQQATQPAPAGMCSGLPLFSGCPARATHLSFP